MPVAFPSILRRSLPVLVGKQGQASSMRLFAAVAQIPKEQVPTTNGDRIIVDGGKPILVANVDGSFYAIDATCPHMNKSMLKGKIMTIGDDPEIRCPIHNSRFSLKTGICTNWVTGVLGYESTMVSTVAQKVGGERRDLAAYRVVANEDGSLTVDDEMKQETD